MATRKSIAFHPNLLPRVAVFRMIPGLRAWEALGMGPPQHRIGNRVVYRRSDVREWIAARRREATCPAAIPTRRFNDAQLDALRRATACALDALEA